MRTLGVIATVILSAFSVAAQHVELSKYRLTSVSVSGSKAFSSDELTRQFPIAPGETFDVSKVRTGLENLQHMYCNAGYPAFASVPDTRIDEAHHTISLSVDVDEGSMYRYGELMVEGEESQSGARQKLLAAWKTYEGKRYDCGKLLETFLHEVHAAPKVKANQVFKEFLDNQMKTVNVQITLAKSPE